MVKKCGHKTEIFSRVCGYSRPVKNWNKGKQEEFKERKKYKIVNDLPIKSPNPPNPT
jgi:ribonucleoside-triphosphate reductase